MCCGSWGRKESETTEQLNWTELTMWGGSCFDFCVGEREFLRRMIWIRLWQPGKLAKVYLEGRASDKGNNFIKATEHRACFAGEARGRRVHMTCHTPGCKSWVGFKVRMMDWTKLQRTLTTEDRGEERKIFKPKVTRLNLKIGKMSPAVMFRKANI